MSAESHHGQIKPHLWKPYLKRRKNFDLIASQLKSKLTVYESKFERTNVCLSASLRPLQEKAEGEPKVKKGKTLLDDDDDEDTEEGADESLEEVQE